jgi:hypothetical protein
MPPHPFSVRHGGLPSQSDPFPSNPGSEQNGGSEPSPLSPGASVASDASTIAAPSQHPASWLTGWTAASMSSGGHDTPWQIHCSSSQVHETDTVIGAGKVRHVAVPSHVPRPEHPTPVPTSLASGHGGLVTSASRPAHVGCAPGAAPGPPSEHTHPVIGGQAPDVASWLDDDPPPPSCPVLVAMLPPQLAITRQIAATMGGRTRRTSARSISTA